MPRILNNECHGNNEVGGSGAAPEERPLFSLSRSICRIRYVMLTSRVGKSSLLLGKLG